MTEKLLRVAFVYDAYNQLVLIIAELEPGNRVWYKSGRDTEWSETIHSTFNELTQYYLDCGCKVEYPEERSAAIQHPTSSDDWESAFRRNRDRMMARMFR